MQYPDVSKRVPALQRELVEITEHDREYFAKKRHSANERAQHKEFRERFYKIRAELRELLEHMAASRNLTSLGKTQGLFFALSVIVLGRVGAL
jgi:hypothetical protein